MNAPAEEATPIEELRAVVKALRAEVAEATTEAAALFSEVREVLEVARQRFGE